MEEQPDLAGVRPATAGPGGAGARAAAPSAARGSREVGVAHAANYASDLSSPIDDDTQVTISIVHASLANAEYPLMIGGFRGEQFSGTDRFLDRQFGGLLTSWSEIDLFPRQLGDSRFIEPDRAGDDTEPPGCYVIGLGPLADLDREQLTFGVRQAVVDRCLRLYRESDETTGERSRVEVGVSSTLIGVRQENGLRIEDSVAGIVEGVLHANLALARYEATLPEQAASVRVTALELVERFAERADLAAVALRRLPTAVQLNESYDVLRSVTVEARPGGLPLGAVLTETSAAWRRFLIASAPPTEEDAVTDERTLLLDVAVLGRDARADRVRHRLDRAMVDALVARVATASDDVRSIGTLYDQLIPHGLRCAFQTTAGVQFIVDATTANYPWELLGAPRPADRRTAGGIGGVMRQFAESEERRLNPERAALGDSLVIAAGRVPATPELPGVHAEAEAVRAVLASALPGRVTVLDDVNGELDLVDVQNELFGDHQILHVASHGVHREGRPDATGAILSSLGMLTVDTVRQLRVVPDVVFLNCCSIGRVGTNRVAAGLAREFMAIGVRALVAAAWPIDDAAACEFASTFYRELIAGRPLGDAVTSARNRCAELGGQETWAAYQCYGDPGFVLRGADPSLASAVSEPVSQSDLVARLETLAVQTSDLGRPGRGSAHDRRARLLAAWRGLAAWIDRHERSMADDDVQRRLATIARDLAEYRAATDRFRRFVVDDSNGVPVVGAVTRSTSVADLQQTANCLARAAQRDARVADPIGLTAPLRADFDLAIELAQSATSFLPDRESFGVLAGAYKRAATVDPERRQQLLADAVAAYRQADEQVTSERYGAETAVQLALLVGGEPAEWARARLATGDVGPVAPSSDRLAAGRRLVDQRRSDPVDFWTRVDVGDRAVTGLIAAPDDPARTAAATAIVAAYQRAFASRSTWAGRNSALDHLRDLVSLLPPGDPRSVHLERARRELEHWEDVHVERTPMARAAPG